MAAAQNLLDHNGADLVGAARGGTFAVSMRLGDHGRDRLIEAVQKSQMDADAVLVVHPRPGMKRSRGII